jgi:drug/metabolite transporter (DMT)-like permease
MAVVAPITAVCAAIVPVLVAFLLGERLPPSAVVGVALAFAAIALVSQPPRQNAADESSWSGVSYSSGLLRALIAGVIIGLFFLSLARTSSAAGLWPLIAARITSVALFGCYAVAKPGALRMDGRAIQTASAAGVLDMLANMLYMVAARVGPLSIVVTLASLYPAATVILARITLGERLGRAQTLGIICALVAVALIVAPSN